MQKISFYTMALDGFEIVKILQLPDLLTSNAVAKWKLMPTTQARSTNSAICFIDFSSTSTPGANPIKNLSAFFIIPLSTNQVAYAHGPSLQPTEGLHPSYRR